MSQNSYQELFDSLKQNGEEHYIENLVHLISMILYERDLYVKNSENQEEREAFFKLLQQKIEETYHDYKTKSSNSSPITEEIELIGVGHTSLAFKIGNVVLKVGKSDNSWVDRKIEKYRDFHCLIPVLYNSSHQISEREFYSIQITPLVDTKDIEEDEVYGSYKSLRKLGYIWNDPLPENTGRIREDIEFNGHLYKKGDIVIIDLEDLSFVGEETSNEILDEISMMSYNRKTYTYETRYIEEKSRGKNK